MVHRAPRRTSIAAVVTGWAGGLGRGKVRFTPVRPLPERKRDHMSPGELVNSIHF